MKKQHQKKTQFPKKTIILLILGFTLIGLTATILFAMTALAQTPELYPSVVQIEGETGSKISYLGRLPGGDWRYILSNVIQMILGITGSLALISFTVGGVMMITGQGNEETIGKAKGIMLWSVAALVIIAASYAIVLGITQLALV